MDFINNIFIKRIMRDEIYLLDPLNSVCFDNNENIFRGGYLLMKYMKIYFLIPCGL
jgi:hypothetical protein